MSVVDRRRRRDGLRLVPFARAALLELGCVSSMSDESVDLAKVEIMGP